MLHIYLFNSGIQSSEDELNDVDLSKRKIKIYFNFYEIWVINIKPFKQVARNHLSGEYLL